jgi:hypothetical protein
MTILEKAIGSNQGGDSNFPNRTLSDSTTIAAKATPFGKYHPPRHPTRLIHHL